ELANREMRQFRSPQVADLGLRQQRIQGGGGERAGSLLGCRRGPGRALAGGAAGGQRSGHDQAQEEGDVDATKAVHGPVPGLDGSGIVRAGGCRCPASVDGRQGAHSLSRSRKPHWRGDSSPVMWSAQSVAARSRSCTSKWLRVRAEWKTRTLRVDSDGFCTITTAIRALDSRTRVLNG